MALLPLEAAAVDYRGSSPGLAAVREEATDGIEGKRWKEDQEGVVREPEGEARRQESEEGRAGVLSGPSSRTRQIGRSPPIVGAADDAGGDGRPRQTLGWMKPSEMFAAAVAITA